MRILAIDWGKKNVGLAIGEKIANELTTISNVDLVKQVKAIVMKEDVEKIVIGYPLRSQGEVGTHNAEIDQFIVAMQKISPNVTIEKIDEAFSTTEARKELAEMGVIGDDAQSRVDQYAAKIILTDYLNSQGN